MGLSNINKTDIDNEKEIVNQLFKHIDTFNSVVFNSGAGSGKTYALVECLKYIIGCNRESLKIHNQKIACITYTNVAAEHIKKQVGVSDIAEISTIHDRIWSIICDQKSALLDLHVEKLNCEIRDIDDQLLQHQDYIQYRNLDRLSQEQFLQLMYKNKESYNKAYNFKAADFKAALPAEVKLQYSELISNVTKFKGLVDRLFRKKRYLDCLGKIKRGEKNYQVVRYDAMYNRDRLDKMRISHDTLLEYGYTLVEKYPRMRQLVIDHYPYILIDEYQDTADIVVKIMSLVEQYAKEIRHNMFIAYFGDSVQNIYDTGVGTKLHELHPNLLSVSKEYNRRSYIEVINAANKVRDDEIEQKSIYSDSEGGSIKVYSGNGGDVGEFISLCAKKWKAQIGKPLHCLFATNQMVAEYSGFLSVYIEFKNAEVYQGIGYKQLNTELLSHDTIHLGKAQALLYRIIKLYTEIREEKKPLRVIFPTDEYRNMSFGSLRSLIFLLKSLDGTTLDELLIKIFEEYKKPDNRMYKFIIEKLFDIEETSYDGVLKYLLTSLYKSKEESTETKEIIRGILNLKIEELLNWYHYINRDEKKEICYHTFHSTKGLEYENVVVVLGKDFGQDKGLFELFFKEYGMNAQISLKYEKGRNILYVVVTRAIKNLRILYIDDVEEVRDSIEKIFGKIDVFSNEIVYNNI